MWCSDEGDLFLSREGHEQALGLRAEERQTLALGRMANQVDLLGAEHRPVDLVQDLQVGLIQVEKGLDRDVGENGVARATAQRPGIAEIGPNRLVGGPPGTAALPPPAR